MKNKHIIFLILFLCFYSGCKRKNANRQIENQMKHTVGLVNLRDVISQTGEVQPVIKVELKSEASGKIQKVFIREGQQLRKGDTILIIDPQSLLNAQKRNELLVRQAKIEMELAKRDYNNSDKMAMTGTISRKTHEDLKSKYGCAEIQYQLRSLELKDVVDQLSKTVITAPMDGVITKLLVKEGEIAVSATSSYQGGTSIGTIADITNLEVITQIGEVDYIHLKPGQKVIIRPEAIDGAQTRGTISFISMSAAKKNGEELGTFEVRVSIDSLIPGVTAGINVNVEFVVLEMNNVLGVPTFYVNKNDSEPTVQLLLINNGVESFKNQNVKLGLSDYKFYQILSGLKEGDIIVLENHSGNSKKGRY